MERSTASSLAGAGALLCAVSLLAPWYVLDAGGATGLGKSGVAALGTVAAVFVLLAFVAGWSGSARIHPLVPLASACGLALFVVAEITSPPLAAGAVGVHYAPAWGIWVAAAGAGMALVGTLASARQSLSLRGI